MAILQTGRIIYSSQFTLSAVSWKKKNQKAFHPIVTNLDKSLSLSGAFITTSNSTYGRQHVLFYTETTAQMRKKFL